MPEYMSSSYFKSATALQKIHGIQIVSMHDTALESTEAIPEDFCWMKQPRESQQTLTIAMRYIEQTARTSIVKKKKESGPAWFTSLRGNILSEHFL
jgi:hypothetical protein